MKRCFVTFDNDDSVSLSDSLEYSISSFSRYPLLRFCKEDFLISGNQKNWKKGYSDIYKTLSIIKALESYEEVVFIDQNSIVTPNIDLIWNYDINGHPLLPLYRFNNFRNWPHPKFDFANSPEFNKPKRKLNLWHADFPKNYHQTHLIFVDRSCLSFLQDVLNCFDDYDDSFTGISFGDEIIYNVLLWKLKSDSNLGDINLCTYHFSTTHIYKFINCSNIKEYVELFDPSIRPYDEKDLEINKTVYNNNLNYHSANRLKLVNAENTIFVLNGNRNADYNKQIANDIIKKIGIEQVVTKKFYRFPF